MHLTPFGGLRPQVATDPEVSLSLGPATIKIPVGGWRRIARMFQPKSLADQVRVVPQFAQLRINGPDEGSFDVQALLINLSRRRLVLERFHCDQWLLQHSVLPDATPHVRGLGSQIARYRVASFGLAFTLNAATIRRISSGIRPAANLFSSPDIRFEIIGLLWLGLGSEPVPCHMQLPSVSANSYRDFGA